jgi:hypothetical protein
MMNSPLVIEHATHAAKRVLYDVSADDGRVDRAYRLILGRLPTSEQRQRSLEYVQNYERLAADSGSSATERRVAAWGSLCQTLIAAGEFRYIY